MLCKMSRDLAILSADNNVASSIYFSDDVENFAIKFHFFLCVVACMIIDLLPTAGDFKK
jgi:hypothetical protein